MKRLAVLVALLGLSYGSVAWAANIEIRHNKAESPKEAYQLSVLQLALSYDKANQYQYVPTQNTYSQSKLIKELENQHLDVIWLGTTQEYEQKFIPIRVPLYKGLLGHRVFIIRDGEQGTFSSVTSLDDLRLLKAGQGRYWADTQILSHANIPVITTSKYPNLFYMLEGARFDYFPRGVHEPWAEINAHQDLPLTVEQDLLLVYPLPAYLFVHANNPQLAAVITKGLEQALSDGSFDKQFYANPMIKQVLANANLGARRVFKINNPNLSEHTPFSDKRLWLDISVL
ncbi:diguanylate cyclase (plasmid) [Saccharobesus litoralis]|uniref:Diguanylate cyclase n=1 Tax=Saccharobesus litoralis TaxID=2172099 RepID=A0A2S0VYI8_9ALTE|nr:diguanylate cyclase [Saccharobesus litoralis]